MKRDVVSPLTIALNEGGSKHHIENGVLRCPDPACANEYPIIRGIPVLVPNAAEFIGANAPSLVATDTLPPATASLIGECAGAGSWFEAARQHISSYAWDHYCTQTTPNSFNATPGCASRTLDRMAAEGGIAATGPAMEIGCGAGGTLLRLATHTTGLLLGIDTHIPMLRFARRSLAEGVAEFDLRTSAFLYRRVKEQVDTTHAKRIDHWCCDATCLPFEPGTFNTVVGLNVLDCVPSPLDMLRSMERVLAPAGRFGICTPYDWSAAVSNPACWIGGHSPRGYFEGEPARVLEALLTPASHPASLTYLRMLKSVDDLPWHVRTHDRGLMQYRLHLVTGAR